MHYFYYGTLYVLEKLSQFYFFCNIFGCVDHLCMALQNFIKLSYKGRSCYHFYLVIIIICYVVFIAFNINHSSILPLMALNSLYCADVPLSNYSLTYKG